MKQNHYIQVLCSAALWIMAAAHSVSAAERCAPPTTHPSSVPVKDGYVEFMEPAILQPLQQALPKVNDSEVDTAMSSSETMWYDEDSMVFGYQDSVGDVTGFRANCVGRSVGENPPVSVVGKLKNFFGPDFRFVFPFRKAAGTDNVEPVKVLNFWSPPKQRGRVLPVKYWRTGSRGHYYWTFPVNTLIGEILYQPGPKGVWYVFEIRTRKRYKEGWQVNLFRPFTTAKSLAAGIAKHRPDWPMSTNLKSIMSHLSNPNTLQAHTWESKPYGKAFSTINGALDRIPEITDVALTVDLLTQTPFVSAEGAIWKENRKLETYGPSSQGGFSIVPKGYEAGMLQVNEVSCNRCHTEASRVINDFDGDVGAYGEIWGEDRIFTWHPFEANDYIYNTFDESDTPATRKINPRLIQANLVKEEKPSGSDENYKPLPSAFVKPFRERFASGFNKYRALGK